jgi:hypothetical protein
MDSPGSQNMTARNSFILLESSRKDEYEDMDDRLREWEEEMWRREGGRRRLNWGKHLSNRVFKRIMSMK